MRRLTVLLLTLCLAPPAMAQVQALKPAAKAKLDKGMKLAGEKKYEEAIKELRAGFVMSEAREFLYAMGQVERIRGDCRAAVMHYQTFLDTKPAADQASAAKLQLERCEAEFKAAEAKNAPPPPPVVMPKESDTPKEPPTVVVVTPPTAPAPVVTPPVVVQAPRTPWYKDPVGDVLLAAGVVVAAGGATSFVVGNSAVASSRTGLDQYAAAKGLGFAQPLGVGLMAGGGALIVASIIRYATFDSSPAPAATVSFVADGTGGAVVLSGGF